MDLLILIFTLSYQNVMKINHNVINIGVSLYKNINMKLIYIKSTMEPKNYSTIRSILKKAQGEKIAPYVFKINDTQTPGISRSGKNYLLSLNYFFTLNQDHLFSLTSIWATWPFCCSFNCLFSSFNLAFPASSSLIRFIFSSPHSFDLSWNLTTSFSIFNSSLAVDSSFSSSLVLFSKRVLKVILCQKVI